MVNVRQKRLEIDREKEGMHGAEYMARSGLKFREWDVLSQAFKLLDSTGEITPAFANEGESPDFVTYGANGELDAPIEITEVLRADYRRGDFWKIASRPDAPKSFTPEPPLKDPWVTLRAGLLAKSKKKYPEGTWLLVYFDIGRFSFEEWDVPYERLLFEEHSRSPFEGLEGFSRVLILWADMRSLAELHPTPKVIVPDVAFLM